MLGHVGLKLAAYCPASLSVVEQHEFAPALLKFPQADPAKHAADGRGEGRDVLPHRLPLEQGGVGQSHGQGGVDVVLALRTRGDDERSEASGRSLVNCDGNTKSTPWLVISFNAISCRSSSSTVAISSSFSWALSAMRSLSASPNRPPGRLPQR